MGQAVEERERVGFDQRMRPAFDQRQCRRGFLGQQPLVTQADEPVRNLVRFQPDVFRLEFLVCPPVADGDTDEDAFPG